MKNSQLIQPIKNKLIRIAIIGCGRISHKHFRAIIAHEDSAELIAICDVDEKNIEKAKDFLIKELNYKKKLKNLLTYRSYDELIKDSYLKK